MMEIKHGWEDITDGVPKEALDDFLDWWKTWYLTCMDEDVAERKEMYKEEARRWGKLCEAIGCNAENYNYEIRFDRLFRRKR